MFFKKYKLIFFAAVVFFLLSYVADLFAPGKYTNSGVINSIEKDIKRKNNDFNNLVSDQFIDQYINNHDEVIFKKFIDKPYYVFLYDSRKTSPVCWNTQMVMPDSNILFSSKEHYLARLQNGWYFVTRKMVSGKHGENYQAIGLIPVKYDYYITNSYLHNSFAALKGIDNRFFISLKPTQIPVKFEGKNIFYLGSTIAGGDNYNNIASILFSLAFILLVLFLINQQAKNILVNKGIRTSFAFLAGCILLLRMISYLFPFPFNFKQFELFNPLLYNSNILLPSLGDLLVNVLLAEWIILFFKEPVMKKKLVWPHVISKKIIYIFFVCAAMITITMLCGYLINSLVSDSQISFDVLNFFSLNLYTVVGFVVICGTASLYFFTVQVLHCILQPVFKQNIYLPLAILITTSFLIMFFIIGNVHFAFYFLLIFWMLLFLFILNYKKLGVFKTKIISAKIIFWIFFFSVSITMVIIAENSRKELENRKQYLQNIADKTDPSGERMMSITLADLKNDYLPLIFDRFKNKGDNYFLKDSLLHENFPGFLNRYDTHIYTFDSTGSPLFNIDSTALNTLNVIVESQGHATSVPDLFYYDVSFERFNYITRKVVKNADGILKGYFFIIASPKRYKSDELYPQLFNKGNADAIENSPLYSYALYVNRFLISSYNDYPFPTRLPAEIKFVGNFYERRINGYSELWYKVNLNKLVVITKPDNINIEAVTLFAYLFCAFLICLTLINIIILFIKSRLNLAEVKQNIQLTVRNQVHGTIILISLISFIIIGITTILFFINRYNKNDHEKLSRTINLIENDIINSTDSTFNFIKNQSAGNSNWTVDSRMESEINRIAEIHGSDINIYGLDGRMKVSSLPLPYNKGILGSLIDPMAYYHLKELNDAQYFRVQKIGDLQYLNNYIPLRNSKGVEFGYLNIPFFESQSKLDEEISNFLVTIINLNAFIFLIAGIIAFFITNRITNSFFFISDKMKAVNLGKTNELIQWNRKDEIGELVKEYNRMVIKLEESAQDLAKSEREGAWKQMARQVAHEIKNPLTPMKLNLQYLQMSINNGSDKVGEISLYVSKILLEQIDHLSQIASDFSQFADLNHSHNQRFDLNEVLNQLYLLYAANENIQISLNIVNDENYIYGDKTQVQRVFTNLIQNAVQSIPEDKSPAITISCDVIDSNCLVTVQDNGAGIPEAMRDRIFTPNFTTKSSGTGLGLAMSKGIIEKLGGNIWFESSLDEGTAFFVEIPLDKS